MKRILLIAVAALAIVACKKDKDEPQQPAPQPAPAPAQPSADQGSIPTTVDFKYPKTLVITSESAGRPAQVRTITYTVDSAKKLLTKAEFSDRGTYVFEYDAKNFLTKAKGDTFTYDFTYNDKGVITKIAISGNQTGTYEYTHNAEGKLTKTAYNGLINMGPGQAPQPDVYEYTYDYSVANKIAVTHKEEGTPTRTYTYTFDTNKNVVELEGTDIGKSTYENYDNKFNLHSKSPFSYLDDYGNFSVYGEKDRLVTSPNNVGKKTNRTIYETATSDYTYQYDGNVVKKSVEVQKNGFGTTTITTVYNY